MPSMAFGRLGAFTTSDPGAGRQYTRFQGPILLGPSLVSTQQPGVAPNAPPHVINVSTFKSDTLISVCSTVFGPLVGTSSSYNVSTGSPAGIVYISMTTGSGNLIAAASTANVPTGLPGGQHGVGLVWDAAGATLAIYDPLSSAWLWPHQLGSSGNGATITWSASSS